MMCLQKIKIRARHVAGWHSACLACKRPRVPPQHHNKQNKLELLRDPAIHFWVYAKRHEQRLKQLSEHSSS
jgi:hypothetical protein